MLWRLLTCTTLAFLATTTAIEQCNDGHGFNATGTCVPCRDQRCQRCHSHYRECHRCQLGWGLVDFINSNSGVWDKECRRCHDGNCVYCGENAYQCMTCRDGYAPVYGEWVCREKWDPDDGAAHSGSVSLTSLGLALPTHYF